MYESELKIPQDRVAVLIGVKGATKYAIQNATHTKIEVSKDGDVLISADEAVAPFIATPIVKAIGRGFNPAIALKLTKDTFCLEIINMQDFTKRSVKKLVRIKARLIGTKGKARQLIERMTNTRIVVYGKTVALIGKTDDVAITKQAIEKLLSGSPHGNVYKFIHDQYRNLKTA